MRRHAQTLLILGFSAILVGYLSVWLRGPGAGLSFLGVEMGEWFKFVGLGSKRDIFYLPPILLGFMLSIWTMTWPSARRGDWRAWSVRLLAIMVSLLAFPAIEDVSGPSREPYLLRVILIALVILAALLSAYWRLPGAWRDLPWLLLAGMGATGLIVPAWLFFQVQAFLSEILGVPVRSGMGFGLNAVGNILVTVVALFRTGTASRMASPFAAKK